MKKQIILNKQQVEFQLKKSRKARRMRLTIYRGGEFVVTAPKGYPDFVIRLYLHQKTEWILKHLQKFSTMAPVQRFTRRDYLQYKEQARKLAYERVQHFNEIYDFKYNRIFIKDQKTVWGSCSSKHNLNFNYKITLLPTELADYIVVHELCHLRQMNHSRMFWNLVAVACPNYKELRRRLKSQGLTLQ